MSTQTAARLQQLAQEMVRRQQAADGGVQQAAYFTESPVENDDTPANAPSNRYQLYR